MTETGYKNVPNVNHDLRKPTWKEILQVTSFYSLGHLSLPVGPEGGLEFKSTIMVRWMGVVLDISASWCWQVSIMPMKSSEGGDNMASRCSGLWTLYF